MLMLLTVMRICDIIRRGCYDFSNASGNKTDDNGNVYGDEIISYDGKMSIGIKVVMTLMKMNMMCMVIVMTTKVMSKGDGGCDTSSVDGEECDSHRCICGDEGSNKG